MNIEKNSVLNERKHFLLRAIYQKHKTKDECSKEIADIDKQLAINLKEALIQCQVALDEEIKTQKNAIFSDGDLKRSVAKIMIKFLSGHFNNSEIKGICRQGYKIMRQKC